ncbi:MAG: hypothetical protein Q7J38_10050 [Gallionella sp.]|nr:hypothetical protein [Gallionella sp.]
MRKFISYVASILFLGCVSTHAIAEVIDPENHVLKNGYHSVKLGDDGKTRFYSFTERAASPRITALENEIAKLPKHVEVQKMCDFMRGGTKAKLIEQRGIAIDVAVTNYGYSGSTVACVLKYMQDSNVGTQLIYSKKGAGGMYMVFVTD